MALLIHDVFKGQKTDQYIQLLEKHYISHVFVPANMTRYFQPLDLTVNGPTKIFLKKKFEIWYAKEGTKQLDKGANIYEIDVKMQLGILKPIHARWLISIYDYLRSQQEMIRKGFDMAGVHQAFEVELESEYPFED